MRKYIFLFLSVWVICCPVAAQNVQLPLDTTVRTGRLPNGMTYYVRSTPVPAGRAFFYLAQQVGSLMENDDQNGLAHFLEHMAFSGTRNFPHKTMVEMLERRGMTYGKDITAYTALNETLYGLNNVPMEKALIDSCLLVLYDWANGLSFDREAVSAERSVILEEWRTRRDALFRMNEKINPVIYKGSQYAVRDIIGDTAIIRTATPDKLRAFYHTWYRPDLQAVIVVGDFDAGVMEQNIRSLFASIPAAVNVPERPFIEIPLDEKFSFVQATDAEAQQERIEIRVVQKAETEPGDQRYTLISEVFNRLTRERLTESFRRDKVPVTGIALMRLSEQPGYNSLLHIVIPRAGYEEKAVGALLAEKERMKRFGFTPEEVARAKTAMLREAEMASREYEKQASSVWVERLSRHFLEKQPVTAPLDYLEFLRRELPSITSDGLVAALRRWDEEGRCVITVTGPEGMKKMEAATFTEIIRQVGQMELKPYAVVTEEYVLHANPSGSGKIVKEKSLKSLQAEEWTLSNGARVLFRPMEGVNQLSLMAYSRGGLAACAVEDAPAASLLPAMVNNYGVGNLNARQLEKFLAGRNISCGITVKPWYSGIGGQAPVEEAETLMQLLWLHLEQPRFDTLIHKGLINSFKKQLADGQDDPFRRISDTLNRMLTNADPRLQSVTPAQVAGITAAQVEKVYRERFGQVSDFTFLFVGNMDSRVLKSLVEKYIGSIPPEKGRNMDADKQIPRTEKVVTKEIVLPLVSPRSTVIVNYSGHMGYTCERELLQMIVKEILEVRVMQQLRMKEGATYQVMTQAAFEANPAGKYSLMFNFDCAPERAKELAAQLNTIVRELAEQEPSADELTKAVKKLQTAQELSRGSAPFWTNTLFFWSLNGIDKTDPYYYQQWMEKIKPSDIREYMKTMLGVADRTELIVNPESL